ncbi:hypothetical protein Tco_1539977 [Tanacetum coccineum]
MFGNDHVAAIWVSVIFNGEYFDHHGFITVEAWGTICSRFGQFCDSDLGLLSEGTLLVRNLDGVDCLQPKYKENPETMNVTFDELSAMAFEQSSSKPGLQSMTSGQFSSGLDLTYAPSTITTQKPTEGDLNADYAICKDTFKSTTCGATILRRKSWLAGHQRNKTVLRCLPPKQIFGPLSFCAQVPLDAGHKGSFFGNSGNSQCVSNDFSDTLIDFSNGFMDLHGQAQNRPTDLSHSDKADLRVILFSIHSDEWKSFQSQHQTALRFSRRWQLLVHVESRFKTSCSIDKDIYMMKAQAHHLLPYHGDSSDDDLVVNSRANFVYPGGNDAGPRIEERAILFLEAQDRVKKDPLFKWG